MSKDTNEVYIHTLADEIKGLKNQLKTLEERLSRLESSAPSFHVDHNRIITPQENDYSSIPDLDSDQLFSWVGKSSLLSRIATTSFILVFALILRTLTDNNIISTKPGSLIGMLYAALLIGWGIRSMMKKSRLATVFPVCGVLLMYSVAFETYIRFNVISSFMFYMILIVLLITVSLVSINFKHSGLSGLATLGTCLVASAIDFPRPFFTPLIFLLLTGNILAYISAKRLERGEWIRFLVFLLTMTVWLLWTFRLKVPLSQNISAEPYLAQSRFLPVLVTFFVTYVAMSAHTFFLRKRSCCFDAVLPTFNVLWAFLMAYTVLTEGLGSITWFSYCSLVMVLILFSLGYYSFRLKPPNSLGTTAFTVAGSTLLLLASPTAAGGVLPALILCSLTAYCMARLSKNLDTGGVRFTSYLLQATSCLIALLSGAFLTDTPQPVMAIITAGIITILGISQYIWIRNNPHQYQVGFFTVVDKADYTGIILLVSGLISGFSMLHLIGSQTVSAMSENPANNLMGIQSLLINFGAISLLIIALIKQKKEILTTAIILIIIGAGKVFLYDLLKSQGIPLVLSVLSFGGVAAVGSVTMKRWSSPDTS